MTPWIWRLIDTVIAFILIIISVSMLKRRMDSRLSLELSGLTYSDLVRFWYD